MTKQSISEYLAEIGRKGGSRSSEAKKQAALKREAAKRAEKSKTDQ